MATINVPSRALVASRFSLRPLLSSIRPSWSIPCEASSSSSTSSSSTLSSTVIKSVAPISAPAGVSSWTSIFPSFTLESLLELIPPVVWASVPKKKTSHSRKSMRAANKGLKNKTNLSLCEACGSIKLTHHVCPTCYSQISRRWKRDARADGPAQSFPEQAIEQRQAAEP